MKVLQLIDSLDPGGAERMAVNLANALYAEGIASYLCATRKEGLLKAQMHPELGYLFLEKKGRFDVKALNRLRNFVKQKQITHVHAHSSSYVFAVLLKWSLPELKLIWHDHYGNSEFLDGRPIQPLKFLSAWFDESIAVNQRLRLWHQQTLNLEHSQYLPNFISLESDTNTSPKLKGLEGKRIVCVANLRPQKDHPNLIHAFHSLHHDFPNWSLHLLGKAFRDDYEKELRALITKFDLKDCVHIYGAVENVQGLLAQANIGVLASKSEGLPLSLLEYGAQALATVATDVGDCSEVIQDQQTGLLIEASDSEALERALEYLIANPLEANRIGQSLQKHVQEQFSQEAVLPKLISLYRAL